MNTLTSASNAMSSEMVNSICNGLSPKPIPGGENAPVIRAFWRQRELLDLVVAAPERGARNAPMGLFFGLDSEFNLR